MKHHHAMKHRVLPLALVCLAASATLAPRAGLAQLRLPSDSAAQRLGATAVLPAAGASASTGVRQADYIVAVVNSEPITNNEVERRAERVEQQIRGQGGTLPPHAALLKDVLERLILEKIQVQLAVQSGIKVDDYAVDQAEQSVARQNSVSVAQMHRQLAAEGITPERFREELRNQLLALRIRERDVESRVRVSDLDVDQYLQEQQQQQQPGGAPLELNLGHILIQVPEGASAQETAQREARAQEVLAKLKAGGDFAALAREYSDAQNKAGGGEMGLRPADRYPELFANATAQADVGAVVGPLRSPAGFHILKVLEKSQGGAAATVVQNHARHILLRTHEGFSERQAAAQLEELRSRVVRGQADFASLAREYSQDGSAKEGGDLGWASPGRYVPEFEQALDALAPGEISHPVVSRFGVHLIQLVGRRQAKLTQREQRDMVRNTVREHKLDKAFADWIEEARARAYVEYRDAPQ